MKKFLLTFTAILFSGAVAHSALGPGSKTNRIYGTYVSDVNANWIEIAADDSKNAMRVSSGGLGAASQRPLIFSAQRTNPGTVLVVATNHNVGINTLTPIWDLTVNGVIWGDSVLSYGSTSTVFFSSIVDTRDLLITSKEEGVGKVWTCTNDITGEGKWQTPSGGGSGTAQTNNLVLGTTNATNVPLTVVPLPTQSSATFFVTSTNGTTPAFSVSNSGAFFGGAGSGAISLYATDQVSRAIISVPETQSGNTELFTPPTSGFLGLSNGVIVEAGNTNITVVTNWGTPSGGVTYTLYTYATGSGTGTNVEAFYIGNTLQMGDTNVIVSDTNAVHLDFSRYNIFKLWMLTNCHLVFTNTYGGLDGLVYFQQDSNGSRDVLSWTLAGGVIQSNESLALTATTNALDLLEVKSGFFTSNLLAYWPQDFQPRIAFTNSLTPHPAYGYIQISNISYVVGEGDGTVTIYLQRTNGTTGAQDVYLTTADDTAVSTNDYYATNALVQWADGNNDQKTIDIVINDDSDIEGGEQFAVYLNNISGGASYGSPELVYVTITDDEAACDTLRNNNSAAASSSMVLGSSTRAYLSQTFWASNSYTPCKVTLTLGTNATPTFAIYAAVYTNSDSGTNIPGGILGSWSAPYYATNLGAQGSVEFTLDTSLLTTDTLYHLVLKVDPPDDANNAALYRSSTGFTRSIHRSSDGTNWPIEIETRTMLYQFYSQ